MAHISIEQQQAIVDEHGLEPMTEHSIQSFDELSAELEKVKTQGYAFGLEELALGLGSIAAPVFDHSSRVVGGLNLVASVEQFQRRFDLYRNLVVETAEQISNRLGYLS